MFYFHFETPNFALMSARLQSSNRMHQSMKNACVNQGNLIIIQVRIYSFRFSIRYDVSDDEQDQLFFRSQTVVIFKQIIREIRERLLIKTT